MDPVARGLKAVQAHSLRRTGFRHLAISNYSFYVPAAVTEDQILDRVPYASRIEVFEVVEDSRGRMPDKLVIIEVPWDRIPLQ